MYFCIFICVYGEKSVLLHANYVFMRTKRYIIFLFATLLAMSVWAQPQRKYQLELGLQAGCGYYVGDATPHIFHNVRETYGAHLRYKFNYRWALQLKGMHHVIRGPIYDETGAVWGEWQNKMINLDVMAEFNFFRFGVSEYDPRIKPITPYIFAGIGVSMYSRYYQTPAAYFPFGFGLKWKFAPRWGLNLAWQHNLFFADDLEGTDSYGNTFNLNGSNILNFDLTGQLTLGIVFEFAREKKICQFCYDN